MAVKLSDYIKPQPKQQECLQYIGGGNIIFFGGSRGGGKSHLALDAAVLTARRFPGISIMIIRSTFPELESVFITPLENRFPSTLFGYKYLTQKNQAKFNNGSVIRFRSIESERDALKVQGVEYQLLIVDEAPNMEEMVLRKLLGSLRNAHIVGFEATALFTGNPGGLSDKYFKDYFIRPKYSRWSPQELKMKNKYIFIESNVTHNKYLGQEYHDMLDALPEHLRRAWRYGDWDVFEGQFFDFSHENHIADEIDIPEHWTKVCGLDLGYTKDHPTVCVWIAQNPETGRLYAYKEYTCFGGSIEQMAREIVSMIDEDEAPPIFADPSMWANNRRYESDESPAVMMMSLGLALIPANNDRVNGWRVMKQWLKYSTNRPPMLQFVDGACPFAMETLPTLKYTPSLRGKKEDLDTKMRDDAADAIRYALMSGFRFPTSMEGPEAASSNPYASEAMNQMESILERYSRINPAAIY